MEVNTGETGNWGEKAFFCTASMIRETSLGTGGGTLSPFDDGEECVDGFRHLSPFLLKRQRRLLARYEVRNIRP